MSSVEPRTFRNTGNDKGTRFCVTINTHDDDPTGVDLQISIDAIERLFEEGHIIYAVGSWERGVDNGRLHLQCWIYLKRQSRVGWFTGQVPRAYAEVQRAKDDDKACLYACNPAKDGWIGKAFEFGERPAKGAGRRTDLDTIDGAIRDGDVMTYRQVNDLSPSVAARHPNWVNWRLEEAARDELNTRDRYADMYTPKVWQYWLSRYLTELPPDERKIVFVVDKLGHAGKTRFCREFKRSSGLRVQSLRPGRAADMADSLEIRTEVIFIDVPRSRNDYIGHVYSFMEEAKDGEVFSPKFHSRYKPLPACHIVMFTNSDVDIGTGGGFYPGSLGLKDVEVRPHGPPLSHDRYAIWELTPNHTRVWSRDLDRWGTECPPFRSFDPEMSITPYIPPFVPSSGPAFNGDIAGDGPIFPEFDSQDTAFRAVVSPRSEFVPVMTIIGNQSRVSFTDSVMGGVPILNSHWYRWELDIGGFDVSGTNLSVPPSVASVMHRYERSFYNFSEWLDHLDMSDSWDDELLSELVSESLSVGSPVEEHLSLAHYSEIPRSRLSEVYTNPTEFTLMVNLVTIERGNFGYQIDDSGIHAAAA